MVMEKVMWLAKHVSFVVSQAFLRENIKYYSNTLQLRRYAGITGDKFYIDTASD